MKAMLNLQIKPRCAGAIFQRMFVMQLIILFLCANSSFGAEPTPKQIAERLQNTYEKTNSLTADFRQVTAMAGSQRKKIGNGTVAILKPRFIRWDYETPDKQVLVSDGKNFSMYFAKSNQMIVRPIDQYLQSDVTYSFFTGAGNLLKDFDVLPPDIKPEEGTYGVKLIPKELHPQVDYLHIVVDKETYVIQMMQIVDQFGTITDLYFKNIKMNQEVDPKRFSFSPPPDTEIILQ